MTDRLEYPQLDRAAKDAVANAMADLAREVDGLPGVSITVDRNVHAEDTKGEGYIDRAAVLALIAEAVRRTG